MTTACVFVPTDPVSLFVLVVVARLAWAFGAVLVKLTVQLARWIRRRWRRKYDIDF